MQRCSEESRTRLRLPSGFFTVLEPSYLVPVLHPTNIYGWIAKAKKNLANSEEEEEKPAEEPAQALEGSGAVCCISGTASAV